MISAASVFVSMASLWTALQGTVGTSATIRGNLRRDYFSGFRSALDMDAVPVLAMGLRESRFTLTLGYSPTFTMRDVAREDRHLLMMHGAYLSAGYTGRGYSLALGQFVSIGEQTYWGLRLMGVPGAPVDPSAPRTDLAPPAEAIYTGTSTTSARVSFQLAPRWASSVTGGYSVTGGIGLKARMTIPQSKTATVGISNGYRLNRFNEMGLTLNGSNIKTSLARDYWTAGGTANWTHQFTEGLSGGLSVGAMGVRYAPPTGPVEYHVYPVATANSNGSLELLRVGRFRMAGGLGLGIGSSVGTYNGLLQQRLQGNANISASYVEFSGTVSGDVGQTIPFNSPDAYRVIGASAGLSYSPFTFLSFDVGYRMSWMKNNMIFPPVVDPNNPTQMPYVQPTHLWLLYFGVTLHGPTFTF